MASKSNPWARRALRQKLEREGKLEGGFSARPRPVVCPRCGGVILVALHPLKAHQIAALQPYPVTPQGEAAALLAGYETFNVWSGEIDTRYSWVITAHPANTRPTYATHRCDGLWENYGAKKRVKKVQSGPPPF